MASAEACTLCNEPCEDPQANALSEPSVQCEVCNKWQHFKCAQVEGEIHRFKFACNGCDPQGQVRKTYDEFILNRNSIDDKTLKLLTAQKSHLDRLDRRTGEFKRDSEGLLRADKDILSKTIKDFESFERNDVSIRISSLQPDHEYYVNYGKIKKRFQVFIEDLTKETEMLARRQRQQGFNSLDQNGRELQLITEEFTNYKRDEQERFRNFISGFNAENLGEIKQVNSSSDLQEMMKLLVTKETKGINLNKLNIPLFNSKPENWRSYREIVQIMMDDCSINSTRRLLALKQSTEGEAYRLIQNIRYGPDADRRAFNLLIGRFDNPRKMINTELANLFNKEKQKDATKNVKALLDCSLNVFSNIEGIIRESEESAAAQEERSKREFSTSEIKEKIADVVFNYSIESRFDNPTALAFSDFLEKHNLKHVTIEQMQAFLEIQAKKLEQSASQIDKHSNTDSQVGAKGYSERFQAPKRSFNNNLQSSVNFVLKPKQNCKFCNKLNHESKRCREFLKLPLTQRWERVKELKLCSNCFSHSYDVNNPCKKPSACNTNGCERKHDVSLHAAPKNFQKKGKRHVFVNKVVNVNKVVTLLPTALVTVHGKDGKEKQSRALIDSGAEISLVTQSLVEELKLKINKNKHEIFGVGGKACNTKGSAKITLETKEKELIKFTATIVPFISNCSTDDITNICNKIPILQDSADPKREGKIEILIGAEVFPKIMKHENNFHVMRSKLGNLVTGPIKTKRLKTINTVSSHPHEFKSEMENEIEDEGKIYQDEVCTRLFNETTNIRNDGRIVVHLPFKDDKLRELGESRKIALSRLFNLEKMLMKDNQMYKTYVKAILDLCSSGQAREVKNGSKGRFFLPHHCVSRNSITTKVRPVFDASVKTKLSNGTPGQSLNNYLHTGEKLQTDIQSVLISFQQWEFAVVADIRQLFLQIEIHEPHKKFLRFLFRENPNQPVKEYEFNRVVFGLSSSPWLAQASLRLSASKEPQINELIKESFYVDDLLKSFSDIAEGVRLINLMIKTLKKNKFVMHKFASNSKTLLSRIEGISDSDEIIAFYPEDVVGTLGLQWNTTSDTFSYSVKIIPEPTKYTKRTILSALASIYDPIGWICCILVPFRLLYQEICATQSDWDTEIDKNIQQRWVQLKEGLSHLEKIQIPRWINASQNNKITLIGSADASEKCAAALIYSRVETSTGVHIKLLAGRTKISPLNKQITLPKLELIAAEMLIHLTVKAAKALKIIINQSTTFLFSDSQVVLCWLKEAEIYKRKVYIANRVIRMNQLIPPQCWNYIKSKDNPADIPSRGITSEQLNECSLYWQGPDWWKQKDWNLSNESFTSNLELKKEFLNVNLA